MKITIEYESSWRNSFLEDIDGNNKPLPKKGRKYVASIQNISGARSNADYYIKREVSKNTVMGVMNRLIGDQRKLYQSRQDKYYYFRQLESKISYKDKALQSQEVVYLRNMNNNEDRNSFTGMIKTNDPIFRSPYSRQFWGVLATEPHELFDFIINDTPTTSIIELNPLAIMSRLKEIQKLKPLSDDKLADKAANVLSSMYPKIEPFSKNGEVKVLPLYCSALYLQIERLSAKKYDTDSALSARGAISGISNNGFTPKDFLQRYTTSGKKKIWGNPFVRKVRIEGEGEVVSFMTKASGKLEIYIDVDRKTAQDIRGLIENAGASSFYLGKKGLAYVTDIDTREQRQ